MLACSFGDRSERATAAPLTLVDSLVLRESDSLQVGSAAGLAVDASGSVYVADAFAARVVRFDLDGKPTGSIGRKGTGPGELASAGPLTVVGDSLLLVLDAQRRQPILFHLHDGTLARAGRPLGVPVHVLSAHVEHDEVWIGYVDARSGTSAVAWDLRTDSVRRVVPLPDEYRGTGLEYAQPGAHALAWRDTVLVGLLGLPDLIVADARGFILDTITVPVRARRGVPRGLAEIYRRDGIGENEISILSILWAVQRLDSGALALIYLDLTPGSEAPRTLRTESFLTLLGSDGRRGCIDLELPIVVDGRPVFAFRGDTLHMLEQRVGNDGEIGLILRRYLLTDDGCPSLGANPRP